MACPTDQERGRIGLELLQHLENAVLDRLLIGDDCWEWQGRIDQEGYGSLWDQRVHRLSHLIFKGTIPPGYHIDHLCDNKRCAKPTHLKAVTPKENILRSNSPSAQNARKTHCLRGHPLSGDNLYEYHHGRQCKACHRLRGQRYRDSGKRKVPPRSTLPWDQWPSRNPVLAQQLKDGYENGKTLAAMARESGLSAAGIRCFLQREGLYGGKAS